MTHNRSVPVDTILPHLVYEDVASALAWLEAAFGLTEYYRYGESGGRIAGAQMRLGGACVMLAEARPGRSSPARLGAFTQSLTVFVEDVEAQYTRARAAGATIVEELHETVYGERQFGVLDHEGHHWLFSRHARDVNPADWGAIVKP